MSGKKDPIEKAGLDNATESYNDIMKKYGSQDFSKDRLYRPTAIKGEKQKPSSNYSNIEDRFKQQEEDEWYRKQKQKK